MLPCLCWVNKTHLARCSRALLVVCTILFVGRIQHNSTFVCSCHCLACTAQLPVSSCFVGRIHHNYDLCSSAFNWRIQYSHV